MVNDTELEEAQRAFQSVEEKFGVDSLEAAFGLKNYADVLRKNSRTLDAVNLEARAKTICTKLSIDPRELGFSIPIPMDRINGLIESKKFSAAIDEAKRTLILLLAENKLAYDEIAIVLDSVERSLRLDGRSTFADLISRTTEQLQCGSEASRLDALVRILPNLSIQPTGLNPILSQRRLQPTYKRTAGTVQQRSGAYLCRSCGFVGRPKKGRKGNGALEFILWWFFLLPGLIYTIWRSGNPILICPTCDKPDVIPASSPIAAKSISSNANVVDQDIALPVATASNDDYKECPFCAETIKRKAIRCRYCNSDLAPS